MSLENFKLVFQDTYRGVHFWYSNENNLFSYEWRPVKFFLVGTAFLMISCLTFINAQDSTQVVGVVVDSVSGDPLPYANISFENSTLGVTSDVDGNFSLSSDKSFSGVLIQYLGYDAQIISISPGQVNNLTVRLSASSLDLNTVEVIEKRSRYRRKGNPAVALMKKVIKNKSQNNLEHYNYYQFDIYEKVQLNASNVSEKLTERKIFSGLEFIFDLIDTSDSGKRYLPIYFQESMATSYYQNTPNSNKKYRKALKVSNIDRNTSDQSFATLIDQLYQDINIYDNQILLFEQAIASPVSNVGLGIYRYYILDTLTFKDQEVINISFVPQNKFDLAFSGDLYITNDSSHQIISVNLGISDQSNLNFAENVKIEQDFESFEGQWVKTKDAFSVDYVLNKNLIGATGKKTVFYGNYIFNRPPETNIHQLPEQLIPDANEGSRSDSFWLENRPVPLSRQENAIYWMIDSLKTVPKIKTAISLFRIFGSGYVPVGPFEIGSFYSFVSNNEVEGWRLKFGGKTNEKFSSNFQFKGFAAYGLKDERFKYSTKFRYIFDDQFNEYPSQYLDITLEDDNIFPGQFIQFLDRDNFYSSLTQGNADRMLSYQSIRMDYFKSFPGEFSFNLHFDRKQQQAQGQLEFAFANNTGGTELLNSIRTTEVGIGLNYAPNIRYYNGRHYRYVMPSKNPIFNISYSTSVKGFFQSDYKYHRLQFGATKESFFDPLGSTKISVEVGKIWGDELPYLLLHLPNANQSLGFQPNAYNLMNFMEFVSDQYISIHAIHYFNGFIFNKIPLLRRLKLRETLSFKAYYGQLSSTNNPLVNEQLIQFTTDEEGIPETYVIGDVPYMEAGFSINNIFKIFQVHFIKRLNYLNHPNVPTLFGYRGAGVKFRAIVNF